jgi:serine/threonine protein phosphatase PrpC
MSEDTKTFQVQSSALTDRGLNDRRPLNEDAFLHDRERSIFAVADGVGGAEAGEVASQTAIEVLDEAFRHQVDGADVEDLMELAIQRANASIHQMAQEHAKFSMMATTIVALHLKATSPRLVTSATLVSTGSRLTANCIARLKIIRSLKRKFAPEE